MAAFYYLFVPLPDLNLIGANIIRGKKQESRAVSPSV